MGCCIILVFYLQIWGECTKTNQQPDNKDTKQFGSKIRERWGHNRKADRISNMGKEFGLEKGSKAKIHLDLPRKTLKKVPDWKMLGHERINGYLFNKFTSIHDRVAIERNRYLQETDIPQWMTKGKTSLIQKDTQKGTTHNAYKPIMCRQMMCKIQATKIRYEIYDSLYFY